MRRPTSDADSAACRHPRLTRREIIRAGGIGILGLGLQELFAIEALAPTVPKARARSVIFVFLSGGLSQIDSFDPKPEAPAEIRGPFRTIPTRTQGLQICEHLPMLAGSSGLWSVVRSLTHPYNEHSQGHHVMLTGRSELPPGFNGNKPRGGDWPSIAALATQALQSKDNLPPAIVLPEKLIHNTGRVIPGQFAAQLGPDFEPWLVEASRFSASTYGAYPEYTFHHERGADKRTQGAFTSPQLALAEGITRERFHRRLTILGEVKAQQRALEAQESAASYSRARQMAVSLLSDSRTRKAFSLEEAEPRLLERYGRNSFGWSLLLARQLVEAGVRLVQVNLGNDETWDTHVNAFHNLEKFLFPPFDRGLSALLEDLESRGLLSETLVVVASEFGRTPKISSIGPNHPPGRDHWGAVQSVLLAGGGVRGGRVIGSSDATGGHPASDPQTPEGLAATIFQALGIPPEFDWHNVQGRPTRLYQGEPIAGLS